MRGNNTALTNLEETRQAMLALLEMTRRSLYLYTPYVETRLYNDMQILDALRNQVRKHPRLHCYWLLPPAAVWRATCPQLLDLHERLSSALQLRTPAQDEPRERPESEQTFFIADNRILLHQVDPRNFIGSFEPDGSSKLLTLQNFFRELWDKSASDPELRRLHL
jgi:hypothetical protein